MADDEIPMVRNCGTMEEHERLLRTDDDYATARNNSETRAWEYATGARDADRSGITVIPVVVHVVWNTNAQNVDDAQINSQMTILNRDFRKQNADVSSTPNVFKPLCGDARIEFVLASTDPAGAATSGIVRKKTTKTSFSQNNGVKADSTGGSDPWPADQYMNIWVCQLSGGLLGYAQFPGGPAATDGVVIRNTAFGDTGTAAAPFNLGRTTTHEIGHWLNLRHIWGDDGNGCSGDDFVADTPNCGSENVGMPIFPHVSCSNGPNGDLFMNYMDYTDDAGMFMFTNGQVNRMQACLDGDRASIGSTKPGPTLAFVDIQPTLARIDIQPTLAWLDNQPTIAQVDIQPTLARLDIQPTLAWLDNQPTIAQVDIQPTLAWLDNQPTIAQVDIQPTVARLDQGPTIAQADIQVTLAQADIQATLARLDQGPTIAQADIQATLAQADIQATLAQADIQATLARLDQGPTIAQVDIQETLARLDQGPTIAQADIGGQTIGAGDIPEGPFIPEEFGPMPFVLATPHHSNAWIASHRALRDQQVDGLAAQAEQLEQALTHFAQAESEGRLSTTEAASAEGLYAAYRKILAELEDLGAFD